MKVCCDECRRYFQINPDDSKYMDWLTLVNFLQFLELEEIITHQTQEEMFGKLMTFKPYALDESLPVLKEEKP